MAALPIRDRVGSVLVGVRFGAEEELVCSVERQAMPASSVVVIHANAALMIFDSCRKQWELPGGTAEAGIS